MRSISFFLSLALHASIIVLAVYLPKLAPPPIMLNVPVYQVDLVTLSGGPGKLSDLMSATSGPGPATAQDEPGPAAPPLEEAKTAPLPEEVKPLPQAKPEPPATAVAMPEPPKPVLQPAKPQPVAPPKPLEGKPISPKKENTPQKPEPKPVAEPKKPEPAAAKKPEPKSKNILKTESEVKKDRSATPDNVLAQALQSARKDAAKREQQNRDVLSKELAALRDAAGGQGAGFGAGGGSGSAGAGGGTGTGIGPGSAPGMAYLRAISQLIKQHWRFPQISGQKVLVAQVEIRLDRNGRILEFMLVGPSGREDFDASALKAIDETRQSESLPPPPQGLSEVRVNFNSQELH